MGGEFHMKFVRPKDGELDPVVLEAFSMLKEHGLIPEWLDQDQCLNVEGPEKNCAYVVDPFEGPAFEHLKLLACRVYGAQCILASLTMQVELPQKKRPIYNVAMKGITISCTSLDKRTRDHVHSLVELMSGEASRNLTEDVTHLVAGEVGSQKYAVAASRATPIMTVDWVHEVWKRAKHRYVHAMDSDFAKYRCPIFKGLVITVSGLSPEERKQVKQYIESEGGRYTGEMKLNECTHLILKEPKGMKYDYACKWKVHVVTLHWLYESLDKNYCQDEKNYPVTAATRNSSNVKTSTPERSRLSAVKPNVADVSAISLTHVDESALVRTVMGDTTNESFEMLDLSRVPAKYFLQFCRIYLSQSIKEPLLEKCKKIIRVGGATRFDVINDSITHIVMEDKVVSELDIINDMELRPHVVSAVWLAECFQQAKHVSEEPFLSPHLLVSEIELPKLKISTRKYLPEKRKQGKGNRLDVISSASSSVVSGDVDEADDGNMEELLSQYMNSSTLGNVTVQPVDEVDGNITSTSRQGPSASHVKSMEAETTVHLDDGELTAREDGIFGGKTFIFCGFSDEDSAVLTEFVTRAGGVYLRAGKRTVPDYAVVPILGCSVEQTVGEVVTNAWLQMCIEIDELLPVDSHPIFQPLHISETVRPLEGCVLSISGYSGVERDCLGHIADILGAVCQEFFVRKATKMLLASTHLIVKEPTGSKYNASKKWNLPAVSKEWLFACAKSGHKEDEEKFNIDNIGNCAMQSQKIYQQPLIVSAKDTVDIAISADCEKSSSSAQSSSHSRPEMPQREVNSSDSHTADKLASKNEKRGGLRSSIPGGHAEHGALLSSSSESSRSVITDSMERVQSSSDREHNNVKSHELTNPMNSAKLMIQQQGSCPLSQKENMTASGNVTTPVLEKKLTNNRVEKLQQQERKSVLSPGLDSPSVFLAPGYRPKFDLQGVFDYLKSPDVPPKKRDSLPMEEVFQHHIAEGVKNSSVRQTIDNRPGSSQPPQTEDRGPLEGVVISVSKKLGMNQTEYNSIVVELGGDYNWQYSSSCTHFIFQGRANDLNKEFRQAKSQGKFIVSPQWLYACQEQKSRVDESMYPHSYNPNLNLGGIVKTETPGRSLRRSAKSTQKSDHDGSSSPTVEPRISARLVAEGKTPAKVSGDAWQESMNEMMSWQAVASPSKNATYSTKKKLLVEVSNTQPTTSKMVQKTKVLSGVNSKPSLQSANEGHSGISNKNDKRGHVEMEIQEKEICVTEVSGAESGGSLEIREALSKTLETVIASKGKSKKFCKKKNKCTEKSSGEGQNNTSGNLSGSVNCHASPWTNKRHAQEAVQTIEGPGGEASQSVQITWDDPTGRLEKEKLAHKLNTYGHSQNTEEFMANLEMPEMTQSPAEVAVSPRLRLRSPTPEPPPLAFPTSKSVSKVPTPQPIEILDEDGSDSNAEHAAKPIILTSGMGPQERIEYAEVIERLGGTVLEKQQFDPACTHVVIGKPSRNEKFLAAVATGRWVLHKSYLMACRQEGRFVTEEEHEWGNPAMSHLMQNLDSQTYSLVQAAYKWRQKVQQMKKKDPNCNGAFQGWCVILLTEPKREDNFRRLLSAGGAKVLNVKPPFGVIEATHAFVELHKVRLSETDLEALVHGVSYILRTEYIAAHLTDPLPVPQNYIPPDIQKLQVRLQGEQARKRKPLQTDNDSSSSKRSRR